MRANQVFVGAIGSADERRGDTMLTRAHDERLGTNGGATSTVRAASRFRVVDQADALSVDGYVDVFEPRVVPRAESHLEHIFAVRGKDVVDDHAASRSVRRAFDVVPRVLREINRVRVGMVDGGGVAVAESQATDIGGRVEIGLEEHRRECLRVGDIVEVRTHLVER